MEAGRTGPPSLRHRLHGGADAVHSGPLGDALSAYRRAEQAHQAGQGPKAVAALHQALAGRLSPAAGEEDRALRTLRNVARGNRQYAACLASQGKTPEAREVCDLTARMADPIDADLEGSTIDGLVAKAVRQMADPMRRQLG